ncbi:MAG: hypothetical protein ACI4TX_03490, partial [Christensenellales bacterium]
NSKGNKVLYAFCYAYLILLFGFLAFTMSATFAPVFVSSGMRAEFFGIVISISQLIMLVFGFSLFIGRLYVSNDNEKIGYMPFTANQIFWAKFMSTYVWLFAINFIILLFSFIGYTITCGFSGLLVLAFLVALILAPIFPMLLSSIITVIILPIYNVIKKNKIVLTVVCVALICVALYYYFQIVGGDMFAVNGEDISLSNSAITTINLLSNILFFNTLIGKIAATTFTYLDSLLLLLTIGALVCLNVFLAKYIIEKSNKQIYETSQSDIKSQVGFGSSTEKTIIKKEFLSIVRFPSLMIYCSAGVILPPLFLIFANDLLAVSEIFQPLIVFSIITFMGASMQMFALSSFTREGEQFYLTKTLPISLKKLADIKVKVAFITNIFTQIASFVACLFVCNMSFAMYILVFALSIIISNAIIYFDVLFDAKKPRLIWDSIYYAMQNNTNTLKSLAITSLFIIVVGIVFAICFFTLDINSAIVVTWILAYIVGIALFIFARKLYNKNVEKYLIEIE